MVRRLRRPSPVVARTVGAALLVLAAYGAAVLWLTWPLGAHLRSRIAHTRPACRTDIPYIAWALAWQSHALATDPARYLDANIYHPARRTLLFGDAGLSALPLFAPVFLATGNPTLAVNVLFLAGLVLTAASFHAVVWWWTRSGLAGLVAGATFLLNPWAIREFYAWAPSYAVMFYFPPLVALAAREPRRLREALALVPLVVLQALANVAYLAVGVVAPLGVLTLARAVRGPTRVAGLRLAAALGVALALMAPVYLGYLGVRLENADIRRQSVWSAHSDVPTIPGLPTVRVAGAPQEALALPSDLVRKRGPTWVGATTALLLVAAGVLARHGFRGGPGVAWRHAAFWTVAGFALSVPGVSVLGGDAWRLPHVWAAERLVPAALTTVRHIGRLGIVAGVGLTLLAGLAFAECAVRVTAWTRRRGAAVVLAGLVLLGLGLEHRAGTPGPFALGRAIGGDSAVVAALRAGTGPVLELPVGWGGTQAWPHARAMYRSIYHWRPLLNGYSSFWPEGWVERMRVARDLPDAAALARLVRETGLTAVVVATGGLAREEREVWHALADGPERADIRLVARGDGLHLFSVGPIALTTGEPSR
jgi:hypothetical protein